MQLNYRDHLLARLLFFCMTLIGAAAAQATENLTPDLIVRALTVRDQTRPISVTIDSRFKPFESVFRRPGEKVLVQELAVTAKYPNTSTQSTRVTLQKLLVGDQSWWVKSNSPSGGWYPVPTSLPAVVAPDYSAYFRKKARPASAETVDGSGRVHAFVVRSILHQPAMKKIRVEIQVSYEFEGPKDSSAMLTPWVEARGEVFKLTSSGPASVFAGKGKRFETVYIWFEADPTMPLIETDSLLFGFFPLDAALNVQLDETKPAKVFQQKFTWQPNIVQAW